MSSWTPAQRRYYASSKGREARLRYQQSEKGRATHAAYLARRIGKLAETKKGKEITQVEIEPKMGKIKSEAVSEK